MQVVRPGSPSRSCEMIGMIVSFALALVAGQVTQIPATQISGDVFQGGDYLT